MSEHLSTLRLHQLRYGELQGDQAADANAHIKQCSLCNERYNVQMQDRAEFQLRSLPPEIRALQPSSHGSGSWWRIAAMPVVLLAAMMLLWLDLTRYLRVQEKSI